jgi:hypothetical protein
MVTKANLELLRETDGAGWITALKAPQIKRLVAQGALQLSLFDQHNLAEITAPEDYPGERLVVCRNPLVAAERARKREELLQATERGLDEIAERVEHGRLRGAAEIGLAVGPAAKRYRMKKHLELQISDTSFSFSRKLKQIAAEAALDGIYVLRTSLAADELPTAEVVRSYKQLEQVERAFRTLKGAELEIRPITTASTTASARTSSSACSPTTSPGTSKPLGRLCSSKTSSRPRPQTPSPRPTAPPPPSAKPPPNAPPPAKPATATRPCSTS